jgi:hypothetical protein
LDARGEVLAVGEADHETERLQDAADWKTAWNSLLQADPGSRSDAD